MAGKVSAPGHGGGKRGRLDVTADPNVIPFIDVMLVLLIIFMIAAPISTVDVNVDMPDAKNLVPQPRKPRPTWISIQMQKDENGNYIRGANGDFAVKYFVMNDEVKNDLSDIAEKTIDSFKENAAVNSPLLVAEMNTTRGLYKLIGDVPVYIRADADTKYGVVQRVMRVLNNKGFYKVALVVEDRRR